MKLRRDVFQAISDPTRRAILLLVASQSLTAGAIASNFDTAMLQLYFAQCINMAHNRLQDIESKLPAGRHVKVTAHVREKQDHLLDCCYLACIRNCINRNSKVIKRKSGNLGNR